MSAPYAGAVRFTGRRALVTGGGHGMGRACAHRLAAEGARVVVADLDLGAAEQVAAELTGRGADAWAVAFDVTATESVPTGVAEAVAHLGGLDVLISTAGGGLAGPDVPLSTDEHWLAQIQLNLLSVVRTIRAALPHLRDGGGSVVSISSVNGITPIGGDPYSTAKAGLGLLTQNLARDHGPAGVRVNLVIPGTIRTRVWDAQPDDLARLTRAVPLGRAGEVEDIAAAAAFLASDEAGWITGASLVVDGGLLTNGVLPRPDPPTG